MWIASRTLPRSVSLPVLTKRLGPSPLPGLGLSGLLGGADKKWAIPTPQRGVAKKGHGSRRGAEGRQVGEEGELRPQRPLWGTSRNQDFLRVEGNFQGAFSKGRACSNGPFRGTSPLADGQENWCWLSSRQRSGSRAHILELSHLV